MANLNRVTLIGRLTKDPELRYIPSGTAVADFDLAVNRTYKDKSGNFQEETLFIRVTIWGKQAERANEMFSKGKEIFVDGYLRQRSWETQDGQKRSTIEVTALNAVPLEKIARGTTPGTPTESTPESFKESPDEEVPF